MFVKCEKCATNFSQQTLGGFDMDTKLATTQIRIQQWAAVIHDRQESGLKVDDYCKQHGLSRNAYYYWLRKVKESALTQTGFVEIQSVITAPEAGSKTPQDESTSFIPQMLVSVNGMSLGIRQDTPMDLFARVIGAIRHAE